MDKDGKVRLVDVFSFGTEEGKEEVSNNNIEEILEKNIEESNKLHENKYISDYNKNNQLTKKDIQSEKIIEEPDLVEQLLENQNNNIDERNKKEMAKNIINQNKKINIYPNKKPLKFPKEFQNNPTPFDFIDFMEKKYNKFLLDQDRDTYFSLEKYEKEGKFKEVKCWKFTQKNSIMNHVLKKVNNNYKKKLTKITCIVANNDLIYIGDDNGIIRIFSLNSEIEIGPLNFKNNDLGNFPNSDENLSVTSMDILSEKDLLACGYYNGIIEIWDLKNRKCRKKLLPSASNHNSQILAIKFLNGDEKMMEVISSDCNGIVNITALTEKIFKFKNTELNAEVNELIKYSQPIFVVEILKFTKEEKKMPFLRKKQNIEIVGFACYDYVFIYQINPTLIELFKFTRPKYFLDYNIADISFGIGYVPRTKNIIDINRDQNQKLNEKASEYCIDAKTINRLVSVSWDTFINIYAIKFDPEYGPEGIAIVGNYVNSCKIKRMFFVSDSVLFIYDEKGKFKLLNTGMMTPGEILLDEKKKIPLYKKENEERALIKELKNIVNKVLKQNYIKQSTKDIEKKNLTEETYYNSIYSNNNNIYILGENELEYGQIYNWEECLNNLKEDLEWVNAFIFGIKLYKGEYISYSGVPIDEKKRKEKVGEKLRKILKEYIDDRFRVDKEHINEAIYNKILTSSIYISIEVCFEIESINFLFNEIEPIYYKKNLESFFYESLEPYIINGNIGNQIVNEKILSKLVLLFSKKRQFQKLGQIIKNLYLSVAESEIVGNRTTKYETIFTGLITYCSSEKNKDFMLPAREIYSYLQSAKQIPRELYWKIKNIDDKKYYFFDYENVVNKTDIDELILSYHYLGSLLLWYIYLCLEGYKFPSGKPIDDKTHEALIQQLFLWLINDEVLQRLIEFDSYSLFFIFKKFFMNKQKIIEKIEYSDLFKLIKIGDKELQEAKIQKYIEIIFKKASRIDKGTDSNIYVNDDLYDFICTIATTIQVIDECEPQNNFLLQALYHVINYNENLKIEEEMEKEIVEQKGENYKQYTELKDKYDRYCMHINRYKEKMYFLNLSKIIMAAIENNLKIFSNKDLENLLKKAEKTELTKLKIYLAQKVENFSKCLDIYLTEYSGEEQIIILYDFIYAELTKLKLDQNKYIKFKDEILSRVTELSSISIDKLIELTDCLFDGDHKKILFKINNKTNKLKYLEEILFKYKDDEISPTDPIASEYTEILKLHIDLLCELKYFDQILPNLKRRIFYPTDYCLKRCTENSILDACIFLERKRGNIDEAIKLVNLFTKNEFNKFKKFLIDNGEEIMKLKQEKKNKNIINKEKNLKNINDLSNLWKKGSEDEESQSDLDDNDINNENIDNDDEKKKNKNENILIKKRKMHIRQMKILKIGIEICLSASEILSKKDAIEKWSSLLKMHYEMKKDILSDIFETKVLNSKIGEKLIQEIENNIGEIIEKMNYHFNLKTIFKVLSDSQGQPLEYEEYKSRLDKLVFCGMSFNYILNSAESILKEDVLNFNKTYRNFLLKGKQFDFEKCDLCGKIFKENEKKNLVFFNCGHKYHYDCTIFVNDEISCKICKDYEKKNEDTFYREDEEIRMAEEEGQNSGKNRINVIKKHSSSMCINKNKIDKEKMKKFKLLNEVNKRYFECSKIFE